jgi:hypothetical protein
MTTYSAIRASDADRENVVAILRDAFTTGRLTLEEFDERTTAALSGRTWGALGELTEDLPQGARLVADLRAAVAPRGRAGAQGSRAGAQGKELPALRAPEAGDRTWRMVPLLPIAAVWLVVALSARMPDSVVPVIIALLLLLRCTVSDRPVRQDAIRRRPARSPQNGTDRDGSGSFR